MGSRYRARGVAPNRADPEFTHQEHGQNANGRPAATTSIASASAVVNRRQPGQALRRAPSPVTAGGQGNRRDGRSGTRPAR
jgi:hypothetical protein